MVTPPPETTTEYATKDDLTSLRAELRNLMIEQEAGLKSDLQIHRMDTERKVNAVRDEQASLREVLTVVNNNLTTMSASLAEVMSELKAIAGKVSNWDVVVTSLQTTQTEIKAKVDKNDAAIDTLTTSFAVVQGNQMALRADIYGDPSKPTGRRSIYDMLHEITQEFPKVLANSARIETLEAARKADAEKWHNRRQAVKGLLKAVLGSQSAMMAVKVAAVGLVSTLAAAVIALVAGG